jgi:hypothetical protein
MHRAFLNIPLAFCFLFAWGAGAQEPLLLDQYRMPVLPLNGRMLPNSHQLFSPSYVGVSDSLLLLVDPEADKPLLIVDKRNGRKLAEFGRKGNGPGEFRGAASIERDPARPSRLWILDVQLRRLTAADIPSLPLRPGFPKYTTATINHPVIRARFVGGDTLVGVGLFPGSERLLLFRPDGSVIAWRGTVPAKPRDIPRGVWQHAQLGQLAVAPNRSRFAVASRYSDRIEIYDARGNRIGQNTRHFDFEPRFDKGHFSVEKGKLGPIMGVGGNTRYGYVGVTATDRHIFAIFSGKTINGFGNSYSLGNYIHVFDWTSKPISVFRVSESIHSLTVEANGSRLYGLRDNPEPAVMIYDLPPLR